MIQVSLTHTYYSTVRQYGCFTFPAAAGFAQHVHSTLSIRFDHDVLTDSIPRLLVSAQVVAGQLHALQYAVLVGNVGIGSATVLSCLVRLVILTVYLVSPRVSHTPSSSL